MIAFIRSSYVTVEVPHGIMLESPLWSVEFELMVLCGYVLGSHNDCFSADKCYSTKEAALAAKRD